MESLIPIQDEEETQIPLEPEDTETPKQPIEEETKSEKAEAQQEIETTSSDDVLSELENKVDEIVSKYHNSSDENSELRSKITLLQTQSDLQKNQIQDLEEQLRLKDRKIEEILQKLNTLLVK